MGSFSSSSLSCLFVLLMMMDSIAGQGIFDVTKYGAIADGKTDSKQAFLDGWKETCAYNGKATFVVPVGTFLVGPVTFDGPCSDGITVDIKGTLLAIPDSTSFSTFGWIEFNHLHELTIGGGGTLDGQGAQSWELKSNCPENVNCRNLPTSLRFNGVNNATISDLNFRNSKGFHVNFHQSANIQAQRLNITAPGDSPNTDGIHVSAADNVNITDTTIGTGDDCISIGPGATNIYIFKVRCGPGHGISIGSLGKYQNEKDVSGVTVKNCTLSDTTNGLRLKSWPGAPASKALSVHFEDVIVENVANPIIIDQQYCPDHNCNDNPSGVKIADVTFTRVQGTSTTPVAVNLACSSAIPCEGVKLEDINLTYLNGEAASSTCSNVNASYIGAQNPSPCKN